MSSVLYRIGRLAARRSWVVVGGWLLVAVALVLLVRLYGSNTSDDLTLPGTGSQAAADLLAERFPPQQNGTSPIVFHTSSGKVTDSRNKQAIEASQTAIAQLSQVYSATSPFGQQGQAQISKDGHTAYIPVVMNVGASDLTQEIAESVLRAAQPGVDAGMDVAAGGPIGSELSEPTTERSEAVGIIAAVLILSFAFGSIVAMGMPIGAAIVGLVAGLSAIGLLGHVATVPSIAPTLATMIGLGVGIDYALFLVSRHRSHLHQGMGLHESIALTVATSGSAVVYAGGTVVIALLALAVAGIPLVTSLGYASAVAVATAVLAAVTLLPALLSVVGGRIDSLRLPRVLRLDPKPPGRGMWAEWARFVTGHPALAALAALVLLVPLLIPFRSLEYGQVDVGAAPESTTERQAYDLMAAGFGVGYNGPLVVAVDLETPAAPSSSYESQLKQAQTLQSQLEQEQSSGTTQKNALQQQQAALEKQQAQLKQQQSELERRQQSLEQQSTQLSADQQQLRARGRTLQQESEAAQKAQRSLARREAALVEQGLGLARRIGSVSRALARNRAATRAADARFARADDPKRKAALGARLRVLGRRGDSLTARLAGLVAEAERLRAAQQRLRTAQSALRTRETGLATAAAALARQAVALASESAALLQQKQDLEQDANALQLQAANLQTEAAELKTQQAQLEGTQQQATTQQQQAEQLKTQLTDELTKAGGDERGTDPRLVKLQDALGAAQGVAQVSPPRINRDGNAAIFSVIATTAPSSPDTADLVKTLRAYTIPQATVGTDDQAFVGGTTAANVDLAAEISSRLALVILTVIGLSFLVLMAAYRSLVVPAQAALANVLSVCAAFGVLTAVFQWGWGLSLVGLGSAGGSVPIASYVPLMMFAVLFGLSMDYQVFLLSQVEHHRARGEGTTRAVASGLERSGPVILAAALIMIAVFGSFVLAGDPTVKQFGVGLAVGVALAAAMVLSLAPAILVLVGQASWWLPERLGRVLPNLDIEGGSHEAETAPADATSADAS